MTKALTDKIYVIALKGGVRIYLNKKEFNLVKRCLQGNTEIIEIGDKVIHSSSVLYVLPIQEIEEADKIKKGDWKCAYGHWHERGEQCGHKLLR